MRQRRRDGSCSAARRLYRRRAGFDEILRSDGSHRARRRRSIPRTRRQADGALPGTRPSAETACISNVRTANIADDS